MTFVSRCCLIVPALLLPLAGCGPAKNAFAPACPDARLIPALADVTRYAKPGSTHDVTDLIVQGRIASVSGRCVDGDTKSSVSVFVQIALSVQRGPAMKGREADVPVFLAITEAENVRDKQVFPVHIAFPANVDKMTVTSPEIELVLPVSQQKTSAAYGVIAGFQLTPEELKANQKAAKG